MRNIGHFLFLLGAALAAPGCFAFSTAKQQPKCSSNASSRCRHGPRGGHSALSMNQPPNQQAGPPTATKGGPPVGAKGGGPPVGGGPGGPPGGPPGASKGGPPGGPPEQTRAQKILEAAFEVGFKLLYLGDDSGIRDSSKNLRVLWTRALLNNLGQIEDNIAAELLPSKSRWVVGKSMANLAWKDSAAVEKLDWIVNRTKFIDEQLNIFLDESKDSAENRQVVLLGSGYDTRSLRYAQANIDIYEVDIPDVIAKKAKLVEQYLEKKNNNQQSMSSINSNINFVPLDLNEILTRNKNIVQELQKAGFDEAKPTIIISEAVLFYLIPAAVEKLMTQLFALQANRYCITDNLAKVGVTPGPPMPVSARQKCEGWLNDNGKELVAHDSIWGGAIHFVGAK